MIKLNSKMKELLLLLENRNLEIDINLNTYRKILFPCFISYEDLVILDFNNDKKDIKFNIEQCIRFFGDKTGIEASESEFRINDYVEEKDFYSILSIGVIAFDTWKYKLKTDFPDKKFYIMLSVNEFYVTLRFHVIRDNEKKWLADDFEEFYEEGIMAEEI